MWIVQVIEIGTGKLLDEFWGRDRQTVQDKADEFAKTYPNASICCDYNSQNVRRYRQTLDNKEKEIEMPNFTQYTCPDCGFKTQFAHYNTSMAELNRHRKLERAIALHPAGKQLSTAK